MKKILLSSILAFALSSNANAADPSLYPSSVTLMTGYTIFSQECKIDSNHAYSFRFTQNDFGVDNFGLGAFQLALDYTPDIPYKTLDEQTTSIKFGPNLLWYLSNSSEVTPYVLLGLGLEHLSNPQSGYSAIDLYANAGAGAEYQLRDDISLVGEAKYSYANKDRKGTTVSAGLKFSFGE